MKKRIFIKSNYALAGVIEALLLVGLVAVILSTIQLYYVPEIMEQKEADHMDEVANQFSQLKSVIEIQSMMGVLQQDQPISYSPMSSPITLGSDKLSYFITSRAIGHIDIIDKDAARDNKIYILPAPGEFLNGIPLTSINYYGDNAYFLDQNYIFEGGGIILNQSDGETMKVSPPIIAENNTDTTNSIKLYYSVPLLVSKPGKNTSAYSIDTTYIRTNYSKNYSHSDDSISSIYIYTDHIEAWNQSLMEDDSGILWEYDDMGYIDVEFDDPISPTRIEITPAGSYDLDIEFTIVELGVQIGPGYV